MTLPTIYTLGHSTRSLEELIGLLGTVEVRELVDVPSAPRSRRHPHLAAGALGRALPTHGIAYRHEQALSGHRHPRQQSPNQAWRERAFGGYADYMNADGFRAALDHLHARATRQTTCLLCAEVNWRRCHRRLICDALLVRGCRVLHLGLREGRHTTNSHRSRLSATITRSHILGCQPSVKRATLRRGAARDMRS
jgi:uncharacterized protein (DUF488 family)